MVLGLCTEGQEAEHGAVVPDGEFGERQRLIGEADELP